MTDIEALYTAARELTTDLLPRLASLIPEKPTVTESRIGSHGKAHAAPLPWNDAPALLYYEIHGDARRYESLLTLRLFGAAKYRPGTDAHTTACITRLPDLIAHGTNNNLDQLDLIDATHALTNWPKQIRRILDDARPNEEPTMRVPGDARCPYCGNPLVLGPGWKTLEENATAICRRCEDAHGQPLTWPVTERIGHLQRGENVTAPVAQQRYGIKQSTFAMWKKRGRIHPYGDDGNGHPTYRVSDILRLTYAPTDKEVAS